MDDVAVRSTSGNHVVESTTDTWCSTVGWKDATSPSRGLPRGTPLLVLV
jgi:hypothetical protein